MQRTLFISDLHLDASRPGTVAALADFLQAQHGRCEALYILGDLFEAWIGDDDDSELAGQVSELLNTLAQSGTAVYLMHGNRDFLIGEAYCQRSGCTLLDDPVTIDLYGEQVLLMHGDSLCTDDAEYMAFRAKMRHPAFQAQLLVKPLAERRAIAADLRARSKEAMSNKAEDIMDVNAVAVAETMRNHNVNTLIHGHTHRPAEHALDDGAVRIVLGDWDSDLWYLEATPDSKRMISAPLGDRLE